MKKTKNITKIIIIDELEVELELDVSNEWASINVKRDGFSILSLNDQTPREIDNLIQILNEVHGEIKELEVIKLNEEDENKV